MLFRVWFLICLGSSSSESPSNLIPSEILQNPIPIRDLESIGLPGDANAQYALASLLALTLTHTEYQTLLFFSASTGGHPLALLAQGWRHLRGASVPQSCQTSALYYLEIARSVAGVYSRSVPQAVELVRLSLHDVTGKSERGIIGSSGHEISVEEISLLNTMAQSEKSVAFQLAKRHLLGTDGVPRSYSRALELLQMHGNDPRGLGLLGYMHAMGLGVQESATRAMELFTDAMNIDGASEGDMALAYNGIGYLEFRENKFSEAFGHFNRSAYAGSSDGLFNLASLYLSGQGVSQSFQRAYVHYSQAAELGHTPATYALGVMLLNGIGVARDCKAGVRLLKEVGERSPEVADLLAIARKNSKNSPTQALVIYSLLAEAGVEVAQSNAAFLIEKGAKIAVSGEIDGFVPAVTVASMQRYLELSADQGGVSSELKLGDLAYYGRGVEAAVGADAASLDLRPRRGPDFPLALASYRKCLESTDVSLASVAAFNLGFMHEFGQGVTTDFSRALGFYQKMTSPTLVTFAQIFLVLHEYWTEVSLEKVRTDWRVQALVTAVAFIPVLLFLRWVNLRR
jgi:TPR repeat protein